VTQAKEELSSLLSQVEKDEEVFIRRGDKTIAKLVKVEETPARRLVGLMKGEFWVAEDLDAMSPDLEKMFYGGTLDPS